MSSVATSDGKDWQRVATAELVSALARLDSLAKQVEGTPSQTQVKSIWNCYLAVEKNVAFIRLELDEENPGRFVNAKAYVVPDERQALAFASNSLRRGIALLQAGDLNRGLKDLRESRNYLRMLLRRERLARRKLASAGTG